MNILHALVVFAALAAPAQKQDAKAGFETMKTMVGEWQGVSHDGRKIRHTVELIAAGTVLMEKSWFEAHPGEMMVTMYHLDGEKLMLTHYCVAKNQPRLECTQISEDGKTLLFTFRDATNLKSRDQGHMDKASYTFVDKDTFSSKWTWYQEGKEQWMEEFTFKRVAPGKATGGGGSPTPGLCCGG